MYDQQQLIDTIAGSSEMNPTGIDLVEYALENYLEDETVESLVEIAEDHDIHISDCIKEDD